MEMVTTAAKYVATTAAKYTLHPALRHIGATTMEGAAIVVTPVTELVKCAAVPIAHFISYVTLTAAQYAWNHIFYYETYVNNLLRKVQEDLQRLEHDVIEKVNLARDNGDEILEVVQNWLKMVIDFRDKATQLYKETGAFNSCSKLAKESKEKIAIVEDLLTEGRSFSSVSNPAPVPPRVPEHFDAFALRKTIKKEVPQALMDDKTNLVRVYGMGKSNKHPLMKSKAVSKPTKPVSSSSSSQVTYIVQPGDTLWSISSRIHGTGERWKELAALNPDILNPNVIFPNQKIRLH